MESTISWGICPDLCADIRLEPNACKLYVIDLSLGCDFKCIYCLFSPLELMAYRLQNPSYKGEVLPLKLDKFLTREHFPPVVYLSYASDPLGGGEVINNTIRVIRRLIERDVHILLLTKGVFTDELLQVVQMRPELMEIQVGVTNCGTTRNRQIEPGAAPYEDRMENLRKLAAIPGLRSLVVRLDPLFPGIDDTDENVRAIVSQASKLGVRRSVMSYLVLTPGMKTSLAAKEYVRASVEALTEQTPTISGQMLYSYPFERKMECLKRFAAICQEYGVEMSVCGCKEHRFRETNFGWTCFPFFTKERREELSSRSLIKLDTSHLKCHAKDARQDAARAGDGAAAVSTGERQENRD